MSRVRGFVDVAVSAVAGAALWASFPELSWWWASIPALAVFFSRVDTASAPRALVNAGAFGAAFWLPLISWAPLATGGGWLPWAALAGSQIVFLLGWALVARLVRVWRWTRGPVGQALVYAVTWTGVEELRSSTPWTGFPWGSVALPQVDSPLGHVAPYGGHVGVAMMTVAIAVLVRRAFSLSRFQDVVRWWGRPLLLAGAVVLFVAPAALVLPNGQEAGALRVGVVQGDVPLPGPAAFAREGEVASLNAAMTDEIARAGEGVDLVIWGETGADRDPRESALVEGIVSVSADRVGAPMLIGFANERGAQRWNWLGVWYPGSGLDESSLYAKQRPVPFGEFIPFRSVVSALATEAAQVGMDMAAGSAPGYMEARVSGSRTVPMAVGICFESAYADLIAEGVRLGGQVIVTPSNNYHFRRSSESAQQGQLLRMRAMEYSRSAIQASTTGRSYVIRPDGSVQAVTEAQAADALVATVPLRTSVTWAAVLDPWPSRVVVWATGVFVLMSAGAGLALRRGGDSDRDSTGYTGE
ncbi:apolipoprotein N-acyltransferase [Actinomyces sp. B33]|nr:apolipoprotein N-acyltransferase [Actinomyces sp. B33]